jgi:glyoxylase-like metal-dependent hydrolase (beta-lactamase superfamily II)
MQDQATSQYVTARQIGEATVTLINDGTLRWNPQLLAPEAEVRQATPEAEADGTLALGLFLAHIRLGDASILVDTGYDNPSPEFAKQHPQFTSSPGLQAGLASIGVRPEEITHVLFTHPHGDHIFAATFERGGERIPVYPNARYFIGRADWDGTPAREQADSVQALHLGTLDRLGLLDLTDGEQEVAPGVTMVAAPGESPGHSIVRVDSGGERFYFLGDLFHHPCEVEHLDWVSPGRNREIMQASRERLIADALATNATLAFSHGQFEPWGRIVQADGGERWEYQ